MAFNWPSKRILRSFIFLFKKFKLFLNPGVHLQPGNYQNILFCSHIFSQGFIRKFTYYKSVFISSKHQVRNFPLFSFSFTKATKRTEPKMLFFSILQIKNKTLEMFQLKITFYVDIKNKI